MKEQTRKDMQQKLANYRQKAPDVDWTALEKALAANRKAAVVPMWGKRLAVAAVVLLMVGLGWQQLVDEKPQTVEPLTAEVVKVPEMEETATPEIVVVEPTQNLVLTAKVNRNNHQTSEPSEQVPEPSEQITEPSEQVPESSERIPEPSEQQPEPSKQDPDLSRPSPERQQVVYPMGRQRRSTGLSNRWTAKVYLSNGIRIDHGTPNSIAVASAFNVQTATNGTPVDTIPPKKPKRPMKAKGLIDHQPVIDEEAHHHQPIRFGLSARYQLDKRWAVEAGLQYTYLSSDITQRTTLGSFAIEQELSYVGLSLNANYTLWSNRHFSLYEAAGTVVEKMVRGKRYDQNRFNTEHVSIHPLQVSLNCGVGAEFKIDRMFSIYAEPGIAYHFDNHSTIPTYYQDKPLGFNLNIGLRLNFSKK